MKVTFEIPGKPFAKQRPRFSRRNGRAFTPKETISFERQVGVIAAQYFDRPFSGPVRLSVAATFEPAKSWSKKKVAGHINRPHTQRPDGDNILKAVSDGLNRIAFEDDAQIAAFSFSKVWGPVARTVVTVEAMEMTE